MKKIFIIFGIVAMVAIIGATFFYNMSVDNKEIALREKFKGQLKVATTSYDLMFKVISQGSQTVDKYSSDFTEVFSKISDNLMSDQAMIQLISGFNPNLSPDLYKELLSTIKTERAKFKRAQDICVDVSRRYTTYIKSQPESWFINKEILEGQDYFNRRFTKDEIKNAKLSVITEEVWQILSYQPVTSTKTKDVFESGVDDDYDLFNKDKKNDSTIENKPKEKLSAEQIEKNEAEMKQYLKDNPEVVLAIGNKTK